MASTASGSDSSSVSTSSHEIIAGGDSIGQTGMEQRPQAGPLPAKTPRLVGEIGYSEEAARLQDDIPDSAADSVENLNAAEVDAQNGQHPAERSNLDLASSSATSLPNASSSTEDTLPNANNSTTSLNTTNTNTTNTTAKHSVFSIHSLSSRLSSKKFAGVTITTLTWFCSLICALSGLIAAWVFTTLSLAKKPLPITNLSQTSGSSAVFVHVAFTIVILLVLIFIERAIFQLRAERYAHIHPGQTLPSHRHRLGAHPSNGRSNGMGFVPWNRPRLPTYAAALGVRGTGDVEDSVIAVPPPPAYGNTRGSTLVLASFWRNSRASNLNPIPRMSAVSTRSLPVSYDEAEHHRDMERARALEEALAKLEEGTGRRYAW